MDSQTLFCTSRSMSWLPGTTKSPVFFGLPGLRGIAGEQDKMDESFFFEQCLQIPQPRVAEDTATAPRLLLLRTLGVEVRNVQKLKPVLPVCHGFHTVYQRCVTALESKGGVLRGGRALELRREMSLARMDRPGGLSYLTQFALKPSWALTLASSLRKRRFWG